MGKNKNKQNKKKSNRIIIPSPKEDINKVKNKLYIAGNKGVSFNEIKSFTPVFSFKYLSLKQTDICFNAKGIAKKDYLGFLVGLKDISDKTYEELKTVENFRFHSINFDDKRVSIKRSAFKKALTNNHNDLSDDELPTLYQFDLNYNQKSRAVGFLYMGVFYLVWFDYSHKIYKNRK